MSRVLRQLALARSSSIGVGRVLPMRAASKKSKGKKGTAVESDSTAVEAPSLESMQSRMEGAVDVLKRELASLRTGRANPRMLDSIHVDAHGSSQMLKQVAQVTARDPRVLTINVFDPKLVPDVVKAVQGANMGLNPQVDNNIIRVPVPKLTAEVREQMAKLAAKHAESARVSIRNVRRDGMSVVKVMEKEASKDEARRIAKELQHITDKFISTVDEVVEKKTKDIRS